jgi:hypothetical protein
LLCPMHTAALPQSILEKDIASIIVIDIIILRVTGRRSGCHRGKLANTKFGSLITAECFECNLYVLETRHIVGVMIDLRVSRFLKRRDGVNARNLISSAWRYAKGLVCEV